MKAIEIDKAAFLFASGWKPEDTEIKPAENLLTEQATDLIKALPKGKASKGITLHLNMIADLLARSGQGNGNEENDEDMSGDEAEESGDEAEEDEGATPTWWQNCLGATCLSQQATRLTERLCSQLRS